MRSGLWWVSFLGLAGCFGGATVTSGGTDSSTGVATGDSGTTGTDGTSATDSGSGTTQGTTGTPGTTSGTSTTNGTSTTSGTTGTINASTPLNGLTVSTVHFAVLGDCRPANYVNDASQVPSVYPTAVIKQIFGEIAGRNPQFALFSGDMVYTYNPPDGSSASAQIDQFLQGRNLLDRPFAPALGNHEDTDGVDVTTWKQKFNQPLVYYGFTVHTSTGDARFTIADDTYWDSNQLNWIQSELRSSEKYHFVIKHYPTNSSDKSNDPLETQFNQLIAQYPPTLILTGHSHTYDHPQSNELVLGTAGAPLAQGAQYGYAMVDQQSSGKFQVTVYSESSNAVLHQWTAP